jgi:hypothetical protein
MRAGRGVIFQAAFAADGWRGYADFLMRVETPSALLWAPCSTVEQMTLVNALCEFADEAGALA